MKILAAADLHGDKSSISELAKKADKEKVDIVVLCGDLTMFEADLEGLIGPFRKGKRKVLLIPGNHESLATVDFLAKLYSPKTYNIHGYSMVFDNVGFFGCGGADLGLLKLDEDTISNTLKQAHEGVKKAKKKIMVTHIPPYKTTVDDVGFDNAGSISVREMIEKFQPDIALCGHIHETMGRKDKIGKTSIFNVGKNGTIIEV
jgi:Icc-related predicted phosphoesterase